MSSVEKGIVRAARVYDSLRSAQCAIRSNGGCGYGVPFSNV